MISEKKLLEEIFQNPDCLETKFKELVEIKDSIFSTLFENEKTGDADEGPPFFRDINQKNKSKETTMKTTERKFAIILSRYRGIISMK